MPPPGHATVPAFDGGWELDGERRPFLSYAEAIDVNWSDELEALHEESSRHHFIDIHTRLALIRAVEPVLRPGALVLDIGCSSGYLLEDLRRTQPAVTAIGLDLVACRAAPRPRQVRPRCRCCSPTARASPGGRGRRRDRLGQRARARSRTTQRRCARCAAFCVRAARPRFVVPAGPGLYDFYDEFLGHERRYARGELAGRGREAGLEVVADAHLGSLHLPAVLVDQEAQPPARRQARPRGARSSWWSATSMRTQGSRLGAAACALERAAARARRRACRSGSARSASSGGRNERALTIVVPAFNEEENVDRVYERLSAVLDAARDGVGADLLGRSRARTAPRSCILALRERDPRVKMLRFARRFGQPAATLAGLEAATRRRGRRDRLRPAGPAGADRRHGRPLARRLRGGLRPAAHARGRDAAQADRRGAGLPLIKRIAEVEIPPNTGDFRLMSRRVVDNVVALDEATASCAGSSALVGFRQTAIQYDRDPRAAGASEVQPVHRLARHRDERDRRLLALPAASDLGGRASCCPAFAFLLALGYLVAKIAGVAFPIGNPTIVIIVSLFSGIQLLSLGIMGEYVGRIYDEVKRRPKFIVECATASSSPRRRWWRRRSTSRRLTWPRAGLHPRRRVGDAPRRGASRTRPSRCFRSPEGRSCTGSWSCSRRHGATRAVLLRRLPRRADRGGDRRRRRFGVQLEYRYDPPELRGHRRRDPRRARRCSAIASSCSTATPTCGSTTPPWTAPTPRAASRR